MTATYFADYRWRCVRHCLCDAEPEELATAMAQAQVERNDEIYHRQRELKEELNSLKDLHSIRKLVVSSEKT